MDDWLNLSETAELLGVHPSTVRAWADRGELPTQRTPGGHRRFRRADVEARARLRDRSQETGAHLIVQNMLGRARLELGEGALNNEPWYQHLDADAGVQLREIGHRLLNLVVRYLVHDEPEADLLNEAREIGRDYQQLGQQGGLTLVDTINAYLFFREFLAQTIYDMALVSGAHGPTDWRQLRSQTLRLTNEVLLALVATYEEDTNAHAE